MNTAFQTGPGFFAVVTHDHDPTIPEGKMRVYCARLEAYDLPIQGSDPDPTFELLVAKSEDDKRVAKALLLLEENIKANRGQIGKNLR